LPEFFAARAAVISALDRPALASVIIRFELLDLASYNHHSEQVANVQSNQMRQHYVDYSLFFRHNQVRPFSWKGQ